MTLEQVDKAFEIITEKDKVNQSSKTIALYGGEPLLRENYDVISYIVEKESGLIILLGLLLMDMI